MLMYCVRPPPPEAVLGMAPALPDTVNVPSDDPLREMATEPVGAAPMLSVAINKPGIQTAVVEVGPHPEAKVPVIGAFVTASVPVPCPAA